MLNQTPELIAEKITVIIPVYNEHAVSEVVQSLQKIQGLSIIIVDDGSDVSVKTLLPPAIPLVYIRHRINLGQGAALQTGFNYARKINADVVVTFDADGQHDAGDIQSLVFPLLKNEADVVLGSRFLLKEKTNMPFSRKCILILARVINFLFTGLMLSDAHNGLRAFNRKAIEKICITENRMAHASEILFEIKKHKLRFKEMPVHIRYTKYARQKGQSGWDSIKVLFDLVLHKLFK